MHRRRFLTGSATAILATGSSNLIGYSSATKQNAAETDSSANDAATRIPRVQNAGTMREEMLYRTIGTTGVEVSVIGLGGSHLGQATVGEDMAVRLIHEALDRGINFLDNSWDYNEGRSEMRVGKALSQSRLSPKGISHDED